MQMNELTENITQETQENNWIVRSEPAFLAKFPYFANKKLTTADLQEILPKLTTADPTDLDKEIICAIYGVANGPAYESVVFTESDCSRVACPVYQLISELLHNRKVIKRMRTLREVYEQVFDLEEMYTIPYVHPRYALMPLGSIEKPDTAWVNPAHLADFISDGSCSYLCFSSGLALASNLSSERTIIKRMTLAFKAFGIYQRDVMGRRAPTQQLLIRFLGISDSPLADRALQHITVGQLPGDDCSFLTAARLYLGKLFLLNDCNMEKALSQL